MAKGSATWNRVKFGEVVRLVRETCKDPVAAGIERVIGLEHLKPGDLRVRSWNDVADGTTFTTRVRPGQVLFGKRRAYQRKVAVADFDAICSGDIYVFESANPERLLPELLPFICQTDAFFEHAVGTSAGSISPRTNWSSLAEYELALPPLEKQRRLVMVLKAAECSLEAARDAVQSSHTVYTAALAAIFIRRQASSGLTPECWSPVGWPCISLGTLSSPDAPISYGIVQPGLSVVGGVPTVTSNNLNVGFRDKIHLTSPSIESVYERSRIRGGDILVTVKGFGTGNIAIVPEFFSGNITRDVARIRMNEEVDANFFFHLWKSPALDRYWRAVSVGTTRPELSIGKLRDMMIPWPKAEVRYRIVSYLVKIEQSIKQLEMRVEQSQALQDSLLHRAIDNGLSVGAA